MQSLTYRIEWRQPHTALEIYSALRYFFENLHVFDVVFILSSRSSLLLRCAICCVVLTFVVDVQISSAL